MVSFDPPVDSIIGGYNHPNAARAYAYLTSIAVSYTKLVYTPATSTDFCSQLDRPLPLSTPIPDHTFFPAYAPSFILDVPPSTMQDQNTEAYLQNVEAAGRHSGHSDSTAKIQNVKKICAQYVLWLKL